MILRATALMCLTGYQRWLSPRKGYSCAYRVHTGRCSCSSFAKRAVKRVGIFAWPKLQRRRFARCKQALTTMMSTGPNPGFGQTEDDRKKRWYHGCWPEIACCGTESLWCIPGFLARTATTSAQTTGEAVEQAATNAANAAETASEAADALGEAASGAADAASGCSDACSCSW